MKSLRRPALSRRGKSSWTGTTAQEGLTDDVDAWPILERVDYLNVDEPTEWDDEEESARILKTRLNLARLEVGEPALAPVPAARPKRIIEIYIDESGDPFNQRDPGFAVGGIVLQHDSEQARKDFHRIINRAPKPCLDAEVKD